MERKKSNILRKWICYALYQFTPNHRQKLHIYFIPIFILCSHFFDIFSSFIHIFYLLFSSLALSCLVFSCLFFSSLFVNLKMSISHLIFSWSFLCLCLCLCLCFFFSFLNKFALTSIFLHIDELS